MALSVVICTYADDRLSELGRAVDSVTRQGEATDEILIVVDHNPPLAARLHREYAYCRVIENEGAPGLSGARNTGLSHATGDIVAFLDDDAVASDTWLSGLKKVYDDEPRAIAAGGSAIPRWSGGTKPAWFPDEFGWVVGCSYRGQPTERAPVRNLLGCNMSVRVPPDGRLPSFSGSVGRVGRRPVGCEETQFFIQAARLQPGGLIVYDPDLAVDHAVGPERMSVRYFLHRCWCEGLSKGAVASTVGSTDALSAERHYVRGTLVGSTRRAVWNGLRRRDMDQLARAAAILMGLATTAAGYLLARGRGRPWRPATPSTPG